MKLLIETFVSVFLLSVAVLVCGQMIGSQLQINEAKDFHAACVGLIETSNFEPFVMESCKQKATERGYELLVETTDRERFLCQDCNTILSTEVTTCTICGGKDIYHYKRQRMGMVELGYTVKIPLLGTQKQGVVNGYAR